jgi:hypothetical protein
MAVADPTAGFAIGSAPLTSAQVQQWANYFGSPAASATTLPQTTNQLVQTGSTFSPTIPWLTAQGAPGGAAASGLQALGIAPSSNPLTLSQNIAASPLAGSSPSNPYYSLILNQMGQGNMTPTYSTQSTTQQVANPWATVGPGGLTGNLTPEESSLLQYFGLNQGQANLLPEMVNSAASPGASPPLPANWATGNYGAGPTG